MHDYNGFFSGWGFFFWVAIWFLMISSFGNWGYTYRAHRLYRGLSSEKTARDILNERYARGELNREEFLRMKSEIGELEKLKDSAPVGLKNEPLKTGALNPNSEFLPS